MKPLFRHNSIQEKVVNEIAAGRSTAEIMGKLKITKKILDATTWVIKRKLKIKVRDHVEAFKEIGKKYRPVDVPPLDDRRSPDEPAGGSTMTPPPPLTDSDLVKDMDDIDLAANILTNKIQKCGRLFGLSEVVKRVLGHAISEVKILVQVAHKNGKE